MRDFRIGTDIKIYWKVTINKGDISLEDTNLVVELTNESGFALRPDFVIDSEKKALEISFPGSMQKMMGAYTLTLWMEKDGQHSVLDHSDAFQLVPYTEFIGNSNDPDNIETDAMIEIIGTAVMGVQGDSAYLTWRKQGHEGSEADFITWLREPSVSAAEYAMREIEVILSNEHYRVENERERVANENQRKDAERLREASENAREANENSRIVNENDRADAEEERNENENKRYTAEQERQRQEDIRIENEKRREAALAQKADKSYVDSNVEELTTRIVGESEARARDIENVSHDIGLKANTLYVDNELAKKANKSELAGKANLNSQGVLATGEEQRLVVDFVNMDGKRVEINIPGVYYNGSTKKIETYEQKGQGMMSIVQCVLAEVPSANVVYCDMMTNTLYRWDGNAMVQVGGGGGSADAYTKEESDKLLKGKVPTTRTINDEPLTDDIVIGSGNIPHDFWTVEEELTWLKYHKVNTDDIVQTTGTGTDKVMSQDAVTKALADAGDTWDTIAEVTTTEDVVKVFLLKQGADIYKKVIITITFPNTPTNVQRLDVYMAGDAVNTVRVFNFSRYNTYPYLCYVDVSNNNLIGYACNNEIVNGTVKEATGRKQSYINNIRVNFYSGVIPSGTMFVAKGVKYTKK